MITPLAADIVQIMLKTIVARPHAVESIELFSSNSPEKQNPFTMKHTTDQMPSQNSSKLTMTEMVELTP